MSRVLTARPEPEAHLLVGALRSEGVSAWLERDGLGSLYGLTFGEFATRILVSDAEYGAAVAVLEDLRHHAT